MKSYYRNMHMVCLIKAGHKGIFKNAYIYSLFDIICKSISNGVSAHFNYFPPNHPYNHYTTLSCYMYICKFEKSTI